MIVNYITKKANSPSKDCIATTDYFTKWTLIFPLDHIYFEYILNRIFANVALDAEPQIAFKGAISYQII